MKRNNNNKKRYMNNNLLSILQFHLMLITISMSKFPIRHVDILHPNKVASNVYNKSVLLCYKPLDCSVVYLLLRLISKHRILPGRLLNWDRFITYLIFPKLLSKIRYSHVESWLQFAKKYFFCT